MPRTLNIRWRFELAKVRKAPGGDAYKLRGHVGLLKHYIEASKQPRTLGLILPK